MKKIIGLSLIAILLLLSLVGCLPIDGSTPANTTANTTVVTTLAAPAVLPTPMLRLVEHSPKKPTDLPTTMPKGISFEKLYSFNSCWTPTDKYFLRDTLLITSLDELNAYFFQSGGYPAGSDAQEIYLRLKQVDFSQNALLLIADRYNVSIELDVERLFIHQNSLIVSYESPTGDGVDMAVSYWWDILLISKSDLPVDAGEMGIFYSIEFSNAVGEDRRLMEFPNLQSPQKQYSFEPLKAK